jgi:hypothetical protein
MVSVLDFPKLESPFKRETINGVYQVVPKLKSEFEWIFSENVLAVDKLHGTNVSVLIQGHNIENIYNRIAKIDLWRSGEWFYEGVKNSIRLGNFCPDSLPDGQYFGELIGPKINANPYNLDKHCWVPFEYLKAHSYYKFWNEIVVKETQNLNEQEKFDYVSKMFKCLWSIYKRQRGIKGEVNEKTVFENSLAAEGIVFYNTKTNAMCKLRRDMFSWYEGKRH